VPGELDVLDPVAEVVLDVELVTTLVVPDNVDDVDVVVVAWLVVDVVVVAWLVVDVVVVAWLVVDVVVP
jgi:hypothetical protein